MKNHQWFTLVSEIISLFVLKQQSRIVNRRCDDVFDPFCRSGPFRAPIWQTIITLIAQLGCLSWWATGRLVTASSTTSTSTTTKLDGVTDAFSDLVAEGPPPPTWAYALITVPAFLTTCYLVIFHITLQSVRVSTALILMMPGYLVELLFDACMRVTNDDDDDDDYCYPPHPYKTLKLPILISITSMSALIIAAWDEISEALRVDTNALAGAFTNTGTDSATVASPDVVVIAILFGIAAGALLALRNVITKGMLHRFELDKNQASTISYVGLWLIICLLPHQPTVDYVYRTAGVIIVELLLGSNIQSSFLALASRAFVIITAALIWMVEPLPHASKSSLFQKTPQQTQMFCEHLRVMSEKRHPRCPLCVRGLD